MSDHEKILELRAAVKAMMAYIERLRAHLKVVNPHWKAPHTDSLKPLNQGYAALRNSQQP